MNRLDLGQSLQILTNIGVITVIVFLGLNIRQDQSQPREIILQITIVIDDYHIISSRWFPLRLLKKSSAIEI